MLHVPLHSYLGDTVEKKEARATKVHSDQWSATGYGNQWSATGYATHD